MSAPWPSHNESGKREETAEVLTAIAKALGRSLDDPADYRLEKCMGRILRGYLVLSVLLPAVLLYPALIYTDLAGMGGYDGFATPEMMQKHGPWATQMDHPTAVYLIFALMALIWVLSLVNMPVAVVTLLRRISHNRKSAVR